MREKLFCFCSALLIRKERPDATVAFDTGDGSLPEDLFELVPYHRVVYILGEEKMAVEEAARKASA